MSLNKIGDVRVAQDDLAGALQAYEESVGDTPAIWRRGTLTMRNGRGMFGCPCAKIALADPSRADALWVEVVERMEAMQQNGTLRPTDAPALEFARSKLP